MKTGQLVFIITCSDGVIACAGNLKLVWRIQRQKRQPDDQNKD